MIEKLKELLNSNKYTPRKLAYYTRTQEGYNYVYDYFTQEIEKFDKWNKLNNIHVIGFDVMIDMKTLYLKCLTGYKEKFILNIS